MEKFKKAAKWFFDSFIWLGLVLFILDIVTKNIVIQNGDYIRKQGGIVLIPGFLRINYLINQNVAFGISLGSPLTNRIVFSIIALLACAGIMVYLIKKWDKTTKFYRAILFMVISGALGNVVDRLFYSAEYLNYEGIQGVVDWIDFYGIWGFNFNVADSAIVVAAFMILIAFIVEEVVEFKNKRKLEKEADDKEEGRVLSASEKEKEDLLNQNKDE